MTSTRTLFALVAVFVLAGRALAFDLSGTWTATTTCTSFFQGAKLTFKQEATVAITQVGNAIGVRADYAGTHVDDYAGIAYPDAKKPDAKGEVALIACGTDSIAGNAPAFDELGRFAATTKPDKVKATLKGVSFFSDPCVAAPEAGTCKWKLTRVDVAGATIPTACPAPGLLVGDGGGPAPDR